MTDIHPTAIVEPGAHLGEGVSVGPYCIIGPDVRLGDGCEVLSHVVLGGRTRMGPNCRVYPFASIGSQPQDMKYHGEPSTLEIGANNIFREHVTVNPRYRGRRHGHRDRQQLPVHGRRACGARLSGRQSCDHGEQRDARRSCDGRGFRDHRWPVGRSPVLPHRPARDGRRHVGRRERCHPLRLRDGRPGALERF